MFAEECRCPNDEGNEEEGKAVRKAFAKAEAKEPFEEKQRMVLIEEEEEDKRSERKVSKIKHP